MNTDIALNTILASNSEKDIINMCKINKTFRYACQNNKERIAKHLLLIAYSDLLEFKPKSTSFADYYKILSNNKFKQQYMDGLIIIKNNINDQIEYFRSDEQAEFYINDSGHSYINDLGRDNFEGIYGKDVRYWF